MILFYLFIYLFFEKTSCFQTLKLKFSLLINRIFTSDSNVVTMLFIDFTANWNLKEIDIIAIIYASIL